MMDQAPVGDDEGQIGTLPPSLRFLKWLVILLTLTMIIGVITVVALLVTRLPQTFRAGPQIPAELNLPEGVKAQAVTMARDWFAIVTEDDRILIFNPEGQLLQEVTVTQATR